MATSSQMTGWLAAAIADALDGAKLTIVPDDGTRAGLVNEMLHHPGTIAPDSVGDVLMVWLDLSARPWVIHRADGWLIEAASELDDVILATAFDGGTRDPAGGIFLPTG